MPPLGNSRSSPIASGPSRMLLAVMRATEPADYERFTVVVMVGVNSCCPTHFAGLTF